MTTAAWTNSLLASDLQEADAPAPGPTYSPTRSPIFDISGIDLDSQVADRHDIARVNPHRGTAACLERIIWMSEDLSRGVGMLYARPTDPWVKDHFPGNPIMPGVLIVEAAGQLGYYLNMRRSAGANRVLFTRINQVTFRAPVRPGDDLLLLCSEVRNSRRCFVSDIQAIVRDTVVMVGRISGAVV